MKSVRWKSSIQRSCLLNRLLSAFRVENWPPAVVDTVKHVAPYLPDETRVTVGGHGLSDFRSRTGPDRVARAYGPPPPRIGRGDATLTLASNSAWPPPSRRSAPSRRRHREKPTHRRQTHRRTTAVTQRAHWRYRVRRFTPRFSVVRYRGFVAMSAVTVAAGLWWPLPSNAVTAAIVFYLCATAVGVSGSMLAVSIALFTRQ